MKKFAPTKRNENVMNQSKTEKKSPEKELSKKESSSVIFSPEPFFPFDHDDDLSVTSITPKTSSELILTDFDQSRTSITPPLPLTSPETSSKLEDEEPEKSTDDSLMMKNSLGEDSLRWVKQYSGSNNGLSLEFFSREMTSPENKNNTHLSWFEQHLSPPRPTKSTSDLNLSNTNSNSPTNQKRFGSLF